MRCIASILACSLALGLPIRASFAAEAVEQQASDRTLALSVDTSALGDQGVGIDKIVIDKLRPHFEAAGFELADDAALALQVRLEPLREGKFDYGLRFEFLGDEGPEPAIEWVACMTCIDSKLLGLVDEKAPALIEAVERRLAGLEAASSTTTSEDTTSDTTDDPTEGGEDEGPTEVPPPIGPMGIVGVVGLAAGVGLSIGGGVELGRGQVDTTDPASLFGTSTDHRPLGRALLGAGIGVAVVGVALLATDLAIRAKKRKKASFAVTPALGRGYAGLGLAGRF